MENTPPWYHFIKHTAEVRIMNKLTLNITDRAKERIAEIGKEVIVFEGTIGIG